MFVPNLTTPYYVYGNNIHSLILSISKQAIKRTNNGRWWDLIGEYRNIKFVVQCKNYTKDKIQSSHIRQFVVRIYNYLKFNLKWSQLKSIIISGNIVELSTGTLDIFVTTIGYTSSSLWVQKCKYDICWPILII